MMVKAPFIKPAEPTPDTARPMMNITEVTALPQMAEPTSNTNRAHSIVHCDLSVAAIGSRSILIDRPWS
jgi:hypothetical protein